MYTLYLVAVGQNIYYYTWKNEKCILQLNSLKGGKKDLGEKAGMILKINL
jgi:hypothetical protein